MASLSRQTPALSYKDLLQLANGGGGVSADEHLPVRDGSGNPVGISLGAGMVSVDFSGGRLSNAVITSRLSAAPYSEVANADGAFVDMNMSAARIIRFTGTSPSSVNLTFALDVPVSGIPEGMQLFAETRMIISAPDSLTLNLQNQNEVSFGSVSYVYNPSLPYLHFKVYAMRSDADPADTMFFVSETQHFGG